MDELIAAMLRKPMSIITIFSALLMLMSLAVLNESNKKIVSKVLIISFVIFGSGFIHGRKDWEKTKTELALLKAQESYYYSFLEIEVGANREEIVEAYDRLYEKYSLDKAKYGQKNPIGIPLNPSGVYEANKNLMYIEVAYKELMEKID